MGQTHIITVQEDGIKDSNHKPDMARSGVLGESIIKLCLDPDYMDLPEGLQRRTYANLGPMGRVNYVEDVHSSETAIFVWAGNCLQSVAQLSDEEFGKLKKVILDQSSHRDRRGVGNDREP